MIEDKKNPILGFRDQYAFLSSFYLCDINYKGVLFESVEHAYQAQKATNEADFNLIKNSFKPSLAKHFAKTIKLREDWTKVKDGVMLDLVRIKFSIPDMRDKLLETADSYLEETNYWNDTYWGVYNGKGKNKLGKILMKVREELRNQ
jgi:ribA/ribD-fused uncharacterized protein